MTAPAPQFPPLFQGEAVAADPFAQACAQAMLGCDAGQVLYRVTPERLTAAIVFAPEVPLAQAMAVMVTCGVGFQNALGALAPPELAVHLTWQGGILVNGAACGRLRAAAAPVASSGEVAPWLVIGLDLPLAAPKGTRPGETPEQTYLFEEGCTEVVPEALLEAWIRHSLTWITRWESDGNRALHAEWRGLAHGIGDEVEVLGQTGIFVGVDDAFGMLLREGAATRLLPLTDLLEGSR